MCFSSFKSFRCGRLQNGTWKTYNMGFMVSYSHLFSLVWGGLWVVCLGLFGFLGYFCGTFFIVFTDV